MNPPQSKAISPDAFAGVLLGTAVGDALGLPAENLSPERIRKWWKGEWRMRLLARLCELSSEAEWRAVLSEIESGLAAQNSVGEFVRVMGQERGVSGYALRVVPVAIYSWLRHPNDFRVALTTALDRGGDTDTVGAVLGALMGANVSEKGIPAEWVKTIWEWPRSGPFMRLVAARMAEQENAGISLGPTRYFWLGLIPRNLIFIIVVLAHGFRRLAPPY